MNFLQLLLTLSGLCEVIPDAESQQVLVSFVELAELFCFLCEKSLFGTACADGCEGSSDPEYEAGAAEQAVSSV
ncbi:MAG: hypothetical protein ACOVRM_11300 [Planctomycetaceae bacterium]